VQKPNVVHYCFIIYSQLTLKILMYVLPNLAHLSPVLTGFNHVDTTGLGRTNLPWVKMLTLASKISVIICYIAVIENQTQTFGFPTLLVRTSLVSDSWYHFVFFLHRLPSSSSSLLYELLQFVFSLC